MQKKYYDKLMQNSTLESRYNHEILLLGFDNDTKEEYFVFLKDHRIYAFRGSKQIEIRSNDQFVQNVSLFPERCNYSFCKFLQMLNISLPFLPWGSERKKEQNYRMDLLGKKSNLRLVIRMEADFYIMNLGAMMISMMFKSGQPRFGKRLSRCDCF
ncbi:MAG: hypothetical protein ACLUN4_13730 [Lachnospiraceae bacterium]